MGDDQQTPQSKGGKARAEKLTREDRRKIASDAARARWGAADDSSIETIHKAVATGEIVVGEFVIPCAVLEDDTRVISTRGMGKALGRAPGGQDWKRAADTDAGNLPYFLTANALKPFIANDIELVEFTPIYYSAGSKSGGIAHGIRAELIPHVCDVWLKAREAGLLTKPQQHTAQRAEALMRGLAHVGIIALIDEATGFQKVRARDALQKILAAYISPELLPWSKVFPDSFYEELHRVRGWRYQPGTNARTAYIGKLTKALIYDPLPPGVIQELERKNPYDPDKRRRKHLHHQLLTREIGHPHLEKQIVSVTTLLRVSDNWNEFSRHFSKAFPPGPDDLFSLPPPNDEGPAD